VKTKLSSKQIERICKALGDPHRLQIVEMIRKEHDWMQCVTIVGELNIVQSTVSHHLKQLVDADILIAIKEGKNAKYVINKEVMNEFIDYMQYLVK
jgi:ArsR family transcriptional regulator